MLVGVKNIGKLKGSPHINEGAELISTCGTGLGSAHNVYNAISVDGTTVFFTAFAAEAGKLPGECAKNPAEPAAEPVVNELYARVNEEKTVAISEPKHPLAQGSGSGPEECNAACEAQTPKEGVFQGASEDGSRVFFTTKQSLVNGDKDIGCEEESGGEGEFSTQAECEAGTETAGGEWKRFGGNDLYMETIGCPAGKEGCAAAEEDVTSLVQVSHDPNIGEEAGVRGVARISEEGNRVYFVASGSLTGANGEGHSPTPGGNNLYVYDTDTKTTKFVATLSSSGSLPGREDAQDWSALDNRPVQATRDGRFFVFPSVEHLTGAEDTSHVAQLFEYDAQTERIVRVSIGQQSPAGYLCQQTHLVEAGYACNGNTTAPGNGFAEHKLAPTISKPFYSGEELPTVAASTLSVTEDGRVFFMSPFALTPFALEESKNIYEYSNGNVYLIAAGEDPALEEATFQASFNEHDRLFSTDEKGTDLFFGSVGQLVPQDTNSQADLYDARVGGGAPVLAGPSGCSGEACRGPGSGAPLLPAPSSPAMAGESAVPPGGGKTGVKPRALTPAQKLKRALTACKKKRDKKKRRTCKAAARKRYSSESKATKTSRRGK